MAGNEDKEAIRLVRNEKGNVIAAVTGETTGPADLDERLGHLPHCAQENILRISRRYPEKDDIILHETLGDRGSKAPYVSGEEFEAPDPKKYGR